MTKARNPMENNAQNSQMVVNHKLLNQLRKDKDLTFADMEKMTKVPESTIKNILLGRTNNPGMESLLPICRVLGIPVEIAYESGDVDEIKKKIENQGIKEENVPVIALKEIYEHQIATMKEANETHISNIRTHYEQHHKDLVDNFEKRLADKREIIELQKSELKVSRAVAWIFGIILIVLLILEVSNPSLGWIRF